MTKKRIVKASQQKEIRQIATHVLVVKDINMKSIRYCNECPFFKTQTDHSDDGYVSFCNAPGMNGLGSDANFKLKNDAYIKPPENCELRKGSILVELEK